MDGYDGGVIKPQRYTRWPFTHSASRHEAPPVAKWADSCRAVAQKLETQNEKEDQISIRITPDNAESEILSGLSKMFSWFFLYGEVAIKSIGGYPKHAHSLAGSFCKKYEYLGYGHSETGYRRNNLSQLWRNLSPDANYANWAKKKNGFSYTRPEQPSFFWIFNGIFVYSARYTRGRFAMPFG